MAKQTIKEKVLQAAETLRGYTTHQELRQWVLLQDMDSAAGFSGFKKALIEIGICYDTWKKSGKPTEESINTVESTKQTALEILAKEINGRVWIKGDKRRIYNPSGEGDNYHYKGKWWLEFDEDGEFEGKCWLEDGYSNKKSEEYMTKHIGQMEHYCEEAMNELGITTDDLAIFESQQSKLSRIEKEEFEKSIIGDKVNAVKDTLAVSKGITELSNCKLASNGSIDFSENLKEQLLKHLNSEPLTVKQNEYIKTNHAVPCVVTLDGCMLESYKGVHTNGSYIDSTGAEIVRELPAMAYVKDGKLLAWNYGYNYNSLAKQLMPPGTQVYEVQPSCSQLCFINKELRENNESVPWIIK